MSALAVILDANVLIPAPLRDILLRAAEADLYRPLWSAAILEEVHWNIIEHSLSDATRARRLIEQIQSVFLEATVVGYEAIIDSVTNDDKDRHVLAAAIVSGAQVIVTANTRHFPDEVLAPYDIIAQPPDQFLVDLIELDPDRMIRIVHEQTIPLRRPPLTVDQVLANIARHAPRFASMVHEEMRRR